MSATDPLDDTLPLGPNRVSELSATLRGLKTLGKSLNTQVSAHVSSIASLTSNLATLQAAHNNLVAAIAAETQRLRIGSTVMAWGTISGAGSATVTVNFGALATMASADSYRVFVHRQARTASATGVRDVPEITVRTTTSFVLAAEASILTSWSYDWFIVGPGTFTP